MSAPKGNRYAAKEGEKATTFLHCRCKPSNKDKWKKSAEASGMTLCQWITTKLNEA